MADMPALERNLRGSRSITILEERASAFAKPSAEKPARPIFLYRCALRGQIGRFDMSSGGLANEQAIPSGVRPLRLIWRPGAVSPEIFTKR
jgi:hypothetical protein